MSSFIHPSTDPLLEPVTELSELELLTPGHRLLLELLRDRLISDRTWRALPPAVSEQLKSIPTRRALLEKLVTHRLLTEYQLTRIESGQRFGLILGNYRVLNRLGGGGMGVVYLAQHVQLPRQVAIKVVSERPGVDAVMLDRFYAEMEVAARLRHPNIVAAVDAGSIDGENAIESTLHYFVMEYAPGHDLEKLVNREGPLAISLVCDYFYQIAAGLEAVHQLEMVHRDVKPANILITEEGRAKLLDFGLARHFDTRNTMPGMVLGSVDFLSPEQAVDSASVDHRADIFGLGASLYWGLTGELPFPRQDQMRATLMARQTAKPPSPRKVRPEVPEELDALVQRMMANRPKDRPANMSAIMRGLLPHLGGVLVAPLEEDHPAPAPRVSQVVRTLPYRALIVDDEPEIRELGRMVLDMVGITSAECDDGQDAWELLNQSHYDLAVLDCDLPGLSGPELLQRIRAHPPAPNLKVVMISGHTRPEHLAELLQKGADDYLNKPLSVEQLRHRVQAVLRLKDAQDQSEVLTQHLLTLNHDLERKLTAEGSHIGHLRSGFIHMLVDLTARRAGIPPQRLWRLGKYCRTLAESASQSPPYAGRIDASFAETLERSVPLLDIGLSVLPDLLLSREGDLRSEERARYRSHTIGGAELFQNALGQGDALMLGFVRTTLEVIRSHHEHWDGSGYPDGLAGEDIPLAARFAAIADTYDECRRPRSEKPGLTHGAAVQLLGSLDGWFDPRLMVVFRRCEGELNRISREMPD